MQQKERLSRKLNYDTAPSFLYIIIQSLYYCILLIREAEEVLPQDPIVLQDLHCGP